ncbi:glycosyltransferase family 2 protein [Mucilaginibacter sp.]|uniref:glycosyltransferase family 2 protein n=1 Tax=Mucilaginibacter sp. TaxID=1882438 RepID=UPI0035BBD311
MQVSDPNHKLAGSGKPTVAVLLTCHNRKNKTLTFLQSLISQPALDQLNADVYLLDDGSTDGTSTSVAQKYPQINILNGTGSLFWAGGMRSVWAYAAAQKPYDLFFLFNDDVILMPDSIVRLLATYSAVNRNKGAILIGSTLSPVTNKLSYGGHALYKPDRAAYYGLKPHDIEPVACQLANANIFFVDHITVAKIGLFAGGYTHYLADFDYTITASRKGVDVVIAPGYYGYCEDDHGVNWLSAEHPLKKRINYLYSVKGLAYKEYLRYIKKHFPKDYLGAVTKLWLKTLLPVIWDKFKRREDK